MRDLQAIDTGIEVLLHYVGRWYTWGGDDPAGFDCSGLSGEFAKMTGLIKIKRKHNASQQFHLFKNMVVENPLKGCFAFCLNSDGHVVHVEICLNDRFTIGASGGSSKVKTIDDAIRYNAFIKMRPIDRLRRGFSKVLFVDPFKL